MKIANKTSKTLYLQMRGDDVILSLHPGMYTEETDLETIVIREA